MAKKAATSKVAATTIPKAAPQKASKATKILPCVCDPEGRLKRVPLAALKRFQGNLKTLHAPQYEKLRDAMLSKGFIAPVFIRAGHDLLVDGHQRLNVLEREGWDVDGGIPVVEIEAADEKDAAEKLLLLSSTYGKIEPQGLYEFTSEHEIDLRDFELPDLPDFDLGSYVVEFYEGANGANAEDPGAQMDRAEELREKWGVRPGQLWVLDRHKLICGDCTDAAVVERVMGGESADLCLTDPPYGIGENYDSFEDTPEQLQKLIEKFLPIVRQISKVVLLTSSVKLHRLYPDPDWTLCWFVSAGTGVGPWGFCCWQPVLAYGKDPYLTTGKGSYPDALGKIENSDDDLGHPCAKPFGVWKWFLERGSITEGEIVLDPFSGSGTTIMACEQLGRQARAIEISPSYVAVALERWQVATTKTPTLLPGA